MKCFLCGKDAVAICRFCGRAVCKEHVKEGPVVRQGIYCGAALGVEREWLEIHRAVWCGVCEITGHGKKTKADTFFEHTSHEA